MESEKQNAALDRVTDFVADKEMDENRVKEALNNLQNAQKKQKEEAEKLKKALMAVSITTSDVDLIQKEFDLPRKDAEMKLREKGDLKATLEALVRAE